MINGGVRLKKDVDWEVLDKYGDFGEKCLISGIDDVPDDLKWWSYWRNVPRTGFIEAIEVNMGSREIRCQGCLDILFDMIQDGIVEKREDTHVYITKTQEVESSYSFITK